VTSTPVIRLLLADDQALVRGALSALLSLESDLEVVAEVASGDAVVPAVLEHRPDVALLDVEMPGLDGIGLVRALRSVPATQDVPVILVSARAGERETIAGLEAGADDFLIKPFSADELLQHIARLYRESAARG